MSTASGASETANESVEENQAKWQYVLRLANNQYAEGLLQKDKYLLWLLEMLESCTAYVLASRCFLRDGSVQAITHIRPEGGRQSLDYNDFFVNKPIQFRADVLIQLHWRI